MGWNVPDDWGSYYCKCSRCGSRYHASEGGCGCTEDHEQCSGDRTGDCYVHVDEAIEWNGQHYCADHLRCDACDVSVAEDATLTDLEGDRFCEDCINLGE